MQLLGPPPPPTFSLPIGRSVGGEKDSSRPSCLSSMGLKYGLARRIPLLASAVAEEERGELTPTLTSRKYIDTLSHLVTPGNTSSHLATHGHNWQHYATINSQPRSASYPGHI